MDAIKGLFNLVADPRLFFILTVVGLVFIVWKREAFVKDSVGYGLMGFLVVFFGWGLTDENFFLIIAKADNVPIGRCQPSNRHQVRRQDHCYV